jgi:hypothetical protein
MKKAQCDYQFQTRVINIFVDERKISLTDITTYGLGNHNKIKQPAIGVQNATALLQIIEIDKIFDKSTER